MCGQKLLSILSVIVALSTSSAFAQADVLKIFSSDTNAAPYIMTDGVTFVGGIVKDMNEEAARRANIKISFSLLSRRSVDTTLLAGEGHMACNIQPAWTKIADQLIWTQPMFTDTDMFWRKNSADAADLRQFEDLKGRSFATYKGYHHHATLDQQVAAGQTRRLDLYPSETIFDALILGRADYIIFSKIRGDYLLKGPKYRALVAETGLVDSSYPDYCAMSRKAPINADLYIRVLNEIAQDGTLNQILARYR
jgi:ABC-type amino acid transport substrate-binding protein